jgi:rhodanese-related sulfurtransferase
MRTIVAINEGRIEAGPDRPDAPPLTPDEVERRLAGGMIALDVRPWEAFETAHVEDSIHVSATSASFEQYVGWIVPDDGALIVIADTAAAAVEAVGKLAFVGLDRRVVGHVTVDAWRGAGRPLRSTPPMPVETVHSRTDQGLRVLDVREREEFLSGHVPGARHINFKYLPNELRALPFATDEPLAVVCAGGLRSAIACSVLRRAGYREARNVDGGMEAWIRAGLPTATDSG